MPIVSINLSEAAHNAYQAMEKGSRSRRVSYLLMRNYSIGWTSQSSWHDCPRCRGKVAPMVEIGDLRIRTNGDRLRWTVEGWVVEE